MPAPEQAQQCVVKGLHAQAEAIDADRPVGRDPPRIQVARIAFDRQLGPGQYLESAPICSAVSRLGVPPPKNMLCTGTPG
jgi:hypothetical protein